MTSRLTTLIILCAIAMGEPSHGQVPRTGADRIRQLLSEDHQVRAQARQRIIEERQDMIAQLIAGINEKARTGANYYSVRDAMQVLGDIRAIEGIDVLIDHIGYPESAKVDPGLSAASPAKLATFEGYLPAINGLVKIGDPCIDPVVMKIRTTSDRVERIACVTVLRLLKTPLARERLAKAQAIASQTELESLNESLRLYDEWLPPKERAAKIQSKLEELLEKNPLRR